MVTYGPWLRGDDYTATTEGGAGGERRYARTFFEETQYPSGGTDPAIVSAAINAERSRAEPPDGISPTPGGFRVGASLYVSVGATTTAPYPFSTWVVRDDVSLLVDARTAMSTSASWQSIPIPPGATGVEFESSTPTPVAATIEIPMIDHAINGTEGIYGVSTTTRVDFYTRAGSVSAPNLGTLATSIVTISPEDPEPTNVTVEVDGSDISATGQVVVSIVSDPSEFTWGVDAADTRNGPWDVGASLLLSLDQPVQTTWTLRPPRYRVIYASGNTVAPLRVIQRGNDGSGLSGGRRILQGRSTQATNRRGAAIR